MAAAFGSWSGQRPHDVFGPGTRLPALVISPSLRGNFVVDHTQDDTTSILTTIERRFELTPLSTHDEASTTCPASAGCAARLQSSRRVP